MADAEFKVHMVPSKQEIKDFMMDYCEKERWMPCKLEEELCWAAGPDGKGFYVGELNGEKITGVSMIQHNDSFAFIGIYYCEEKYRGRGFGFETWKAAQSTIDPSVNLGLDAALTAAHLYEQIGFKKYWKASYHYITVSSILDVYAKVKFPSIIRIKPAAEVDFAKLKLYIEDVIGVTFNRSAFLENWIGLASSKAIAAVDDSGAIVGFATLRESVNLSSDGYHLGPLLANDANTARFLMLSCARSVELTQRLYIGSFEDNHEATVIKSELETEWAYDTIRMYTKGPLPLKMEKYFAIFSYNWIG